MYSEDPHGSACGAVISGHLAKNAGGFVSAQGPAPPAQLLKPEAPIKSTPMSKTVGPLTIGGKIFCSNLGGRKEMAISTNEHRAAVPIRAPQALGQDPLLPSASEGQYPFAYI